MTWRTSSKLPRVQVDRLTPPSVEQIRSIKSGLMWFPERRRVALLLDVARNHDAGRLADAMTTLRWVVDWAPQPLPTRLTDLVAMCDRLVPVVAPPATSPMLPVNVAESDSAQVPPTARRTHSWPCLSVHDDRPTAVTQSSAGSTRPSTGRAGASGRTGSATGGAATLARSRTVAHSQSAPV